MSWRSIFALLILAAAASAWGGLRLGNWLVAHGPTVVVALPNQPDPASVPVLDPDGKPITAQPPQPLPNGHLGIPGKLAEVAWQIPEASLAETKANQVIPVSTTTITMVEAQQIAAGNAGGNRSLVGIGDVGDLLGSGGGAKPPLQPVEAPDAPPQPPATSPPPQPGASTAWQASLRQDLQACNAESFFDRPSCAWAARNKYCTPNNAWGVISDCPDKRY